MFCRSVVFVNLKQLLCSSSVKHLSLIGIKREPKQGFLFANLSIEKHVLLWPPFVEYL